MSTRNVAACILIRNNEQLAKLSDTPYQKCVFPQFQATPACVLGTMFAFLSVLCMIVGVGLCVYRW